MLTTIHRYPTHLIDVLGLPSGDRVTIRPILPQDAPLEQEFVRALSLGARYNRFFRTLLELPPGLLARFTEVDYRATHALVASVRRAGGERIIADARYAPASEAGSAEFAFAVADAWQGRGIASALLRRLACAAASAGISRLTGEALAMNEAMLSLARKAGFSLKAEPRMLSVIRLSRTIDGLPCAEHPARVAA